MVTKSERPKSSIVDVNSLTANMYGCEPCPKCGSKYRCVFAKKPDLIQCDDCGYHEKISDRGEES